jgi:hypothetical protein
MAYMTKLNDADLFDLQYFCEILKSKTLDSLYKVSDNTADIWHLTKAIVEVVGRGGFSIYEDDYVASLKREIRVQRKEIAGLREERRMFLDRDIPPNAFNP